MRRKDGGFTLVEMMVVMAVIAIATAAVPALLAGVSGARLRAVADDMIGRLRDTRQQAILHGTPTDLILDPVRRAYRMSTDSQIRALPAAVDRLEIAPGLVGPDGVARIRFFADGSATAGLVRLRSGGRSVGIAIDWLTGRVRRDE